MKKKMCGLLLGGLVLLNVIPVVAMSGTHNDIKYYGNIKNNNMTVEAGITASMKYPSVEATIWYTGNKSSKQTGTSYASYCYVAVNTPGSNYKITNNKLVFQASNFHLTTKAD